MKQLLLIALVACDGKDAGIDSGVDGHERNIDSGGTCDSGACNTDSAISICTAVSDNCTGETICIASACEPAFPRTYVITNVMVSLAATNPYGQPWDTDATAPDLYVSDLTVQGSGAPITAVAPNTLTATFPGPLEVTLSSGIPFQIEIWDNDSPPVTARQIAFSCFMNPVSAYWLRPRTWGCSYGGSSLTLTVNPKAP